MAIHSDTQINSKTEKRGVVKGQDIENKKKEEKARGSEAKEIISYPDNLERLVLDINLFSLSIF